jgi:hypothetical protein
MTIDQENKVTIGIHVLSEFVFCPRAGLITHGERKQDTGVEESVSNLNFTPLYELQEIDARLVELQKNIFRCFALMIGLAIAGILSVIFFDWRFAFIAAFLICVVLKSVAGDGVRAFRFLKLRHEFTSVESQLPNLNNPEVEEFDWRAIIRVNFDLERCNDRFVDFDLGISGKPWRLLKRGSLCIPVFKCRPTQPQNPESKHPANWLYQQHYVRITGYCKLIESQTNHLAPFGLILFGGTYRAFAVKPDAASSEAMDRALTEARFRIEEFGLGKKPNPPNPKICRGCFHGRLRKRDIERTVLQHNGEEVPPKLVLLDHKHQHSRCGDLFEWIAPHEKAKKNGLCRT